MSLAYQSFPWVRVDPVPPSVVYGENDVCTIPIFGAPGTGGTDFLVCGESAIYANLGAGTQVTNEEIYISPEAGHHAHFSTNVTYQGLGSQLENFYFQGRSVASKVSCTKEPLTLSAELGTALMGLATNSMISTGMSSGQSATNPWVPFCFPMQFCLNNVKGNLPVAFDRLGIIQVQFTLLPDRQALAGAGMVGNTDAGRQIRNLCILYKQANLTPEQIQRPLTFITHVGTRKFLTMTNDTLTTIQSGIAEGFTVTFIKTDHENTLGSDYFRAETLKGQPLYAQTTAGVLVRQPFENYGASSVEFSIQNQDTLFFTYKLDNQEEIVRNYIVANGGNLRKYSSYLKRLESGYGYGIGVNFGTPIDITGKEFKVKILSAITEQYTAYMDFRMLKTI